MSERTMKDFLDKFDEAFFACVDTGKQSRLTLQIGDRGITIDIKETGKAQVDFDALLQQTVRNRVREVK